MNLPNTREVDTMQERLQQLRRENFKLRNEISEIRAMLQRGAGKQAAAKVSAEPAVEKPSSATTAKKAPAKKAAARKTAARKAPAKKKAAVSNETKGA
jgi:hypothetical protein